MNKFFLILLIVFGLFLCLFSFFFGSADEFTVIQRGENIYNKPAAFTKLTKNIFLVYATSVLIFSSLMWLIDCLNFY